MKSSHKSFLFLTFTLLFALFTSCNGFFNQKKAVDAQKANSPEPGFTYVGIVAAPKGSGARTALPQDFPTAETLTNYKLTTTYKVGDSDVEDSENTRKGLTFAKLSEVQLKLENKREYTFTLTAEYKGTGWYATDTWSHDDSKEKIEFVLEQGATGTGKLSIDADVSEVTAYIKSVKIWVSDEMDFAREVDPAETYDYSETACQDHISYSADVDAGKYWMLMEITDRSGLTTVAGPELAYVYPTLTTAWNPVIRELNRNYKITFSPEGIILNDGIILDDESFKVSARLVNGASFPDEPWEQNIYGSTTALPNNWNESLNMEDLFIPPAGYSFYGWWDKESYDGDEIKAFGTYNQIRSGTYTDDVTLYPVWTNNNIIYGNSTAEEISFFVSQQSQNGSDTITVIFDSSFNTAENYEQLWNSTLSALNSTECKTDLYLEDSAAWFAERIAGTEETPNIWLKSVTFSGLETVSSGTFDYCTELETVTFKGSSDTDENSITFDVQAFTGAEKLSDIVFADAPTSTVINMTGEISDWSKMSFLKNISTGVGKTVSLDMSSCTVTGSSSAKTVPTNMFSNSTNVNNATKTGAYVKDVTFPDGITSLTGSTFYNCKNLSKVSLPSSVTSLGSCAFQNSTLEELEFRGEVAVRQILAGCFDGCRNLKGIELGTKLTSIGQTAFTGAGLTSLTLPATVTTISDRAFSSCSALTAITVDGNPSDTWISSYSWPNNSSHKMQLGISNSGLSSLLTGSSSNHNFYRNKDVESTKSLITNMVSNINNYSGSTSANTFDITISGSFDDWSIFAPFSDITKNTNIDMSGAIDNSLSHLIPDELKEKIDNKEFIISFIKPENTLQNEYVISLSGFTYKEGIGSQISENVDYYNSNKGSYCLDTEKNTITFTAGTDLMTRNEMVTVIKRLIFNNLEDIHMNLTGDIYNFRFEQELPESFTIGTNTLTRGLMTEPSNLDLFRQVTYTIHLGTSDGTPVTLNDPDYSDSLWTGEYDYEVTRGNDGTDVIITGYEGSVFPYNSSQFRSQILEETTAAAKKDEALFSFVSPFQEGETTVIWDSQPITNEAELRAAAETGGYYHLTGEITVTEPILIRESLILEGEGNSIKKTGDAWTIPEEELTESTPGIKALFFTEEGNSEIDLTMKNVTLDGGFISEEEGIKSSDSGLLEFGGDTIILDNVTFQNNWKQWDYACFSGLNLNGATATINSCTFQNLHIRGDEGRAPGICISQGNVTITDCRFANNTASEDHNFGKDIWIDTFYPYPDEKVTVTGNTAHSDPNSYLEIGTHVPGALELGSETGKIKISELSEGWEDSYCTYFHGTEEQP